jgi:hypothetical protein
MRCRWCAAPCFWQPHFPNCGPALADQLSDLLRVKDSIRIEGERLRAEASRLNDGRTRLAELQESKRQSLAEPQTELAQARQAIAKLTRKPDSLVVPEK